MSFLDDALRLAIAREEAKIKAPVAVQTQEQMFVARSGNLPAQPASNPVSSMPVNQNQMLMIGGALLAAVVLYQVVK